MLVCTSVDFRKYCKWVGTAHWYLLEITPLHKNFSASLDNCFQHTLTKKPIRTYEHVTWKHPQGTNALHSPAVRSWLHSLFARPEDLCKIHPRPQLQCDAVRPVELLSCKIRGTSQERASRNVQQRVLCLLSSETCGAYLYRAVRNKQVILGA